MLLLPNLGMPEIIMILIVALLVFGPKKLPEIGQQLGRAFRDFRKSTSGLVDSINEEVKAQPKAQTSPTASLESKKVGSTAVEDEDVTVIDVEAESEKIEDSSKEA